MLVIQARPFNWWKTLLVASMAGAIAVTLVIPGLRDFYALQLPPNDVLVEAAHHRGRRDRAPGGGLASQSRRRQPSRRRAEAALQPVLLLNTM